MQDFQITPLLKIAEEIANEKTMKHKPQSRTIDRLMKIVTENGKFAYGTPSRALDVVEHVFAAHRRMSNNLQTLVQKHNLGDAGMPVDEIVCAELAKFLRFPPPVDNEFVAPGCEKFGRP